LKERPITRDELEAAREGIVRSLPGWFETVDGLGSAAGSLYWRDLPLDRYEKMIAALLGADAAKVQALAEQYYAPALMKVVLVGDPETVDKQVPPLGLGELKKVAPPEMPAAAGAPGAGKK
jgi:predicted Zn-dependent peptidase